jgi:hypothetical protein
MHEVVLMITAVVLVYKLLWFTVSLVLMRNLWEGNR